MRLADHRQAEALRGLAAAQRVAVRHAGHPAVLDHHDGVGGGHRHPDGVVGIQGTHAAGDRGLVEQWAGGVVEQHLALGRAQRGDRPPGRLRAGLPAFDDPGHLAVSAQRQHLTGVVRVPRRHHHQRGVHPGSLVERGDRVLQQGPASQREQLLGERGAEAHPRAGRQHHSHRSHERTLPGLGGRTCTGCQRRRTGCQCRTESGCPRPGPPEDRFLSPRSSRRGGTGGQGC